MTTANQADSAYRVSVETLPSPDALRVMWREVEATSQCSFFTSWAWIGPWLAIACPPRIARLVSVHFGAQRIALGVFTERRRFLGLGPMHLRLHEMGDKALDSLTIEYNGLICESGHEKAALAAVLQHFIRMDSRWLTLYLPGMETDRVPADLIKADGFSLRVENRAARYVDLALLREGVHDYVVTALSSNARSAVRRTARKIINRHGELSVSVAQDQEQRLAYFHAMVGLHQAHWKGVLNEPGAFSDTRIVRFHEKLIEASTDQGGAQLLRLIAGEHVVGYAYNLVWRGTVYFYQSGVDYPSFASSGSPGLLLLVHAIEQSLADGHSRFELMAGDSAYKQVLGTSQNTMAWISVDREGWESRLRRAWWSLKRGVR